MYMYRRMYRSLLALRGTSAANALCHQIALGDAFDVKVGEYS